MTDTAKPTPGPWYYVPYPAGIGGFVNAGDPSGPAICDLSKYEHPETNGRFIAEAGTVYHETGLTPRQLLEQRGDAINRLQNSAVANTTLMKQVEALTEQRDELRDALGQAITMLAFAAHTPSTRPPTQFEDEGSKVVEKCRAALAKCGKAGG